MLKFVVKNLYNLAAKLFMFANTENYLRNRRVGMCCLRRKGK